MNFINNLHPCFQIPGAGVQAAGLHQRAGGTQRLRPGPAHRACLRPRKPEAGLQPGGPRGRYILPYGIQQVQNLPIVFLSLFLSHSHSQCLCLCHENLEQDYMYSRSFSVISVSIVTLFLFASFTKTSKRTCIYDFQIMYYISVPFDSYIYFLSFLLYYLFRSGWTEFFICKFTRCSGQPFPAGPIPGIVLYCSRQ